MMAITHCAIAVASTSLILGTASPMVLGLAILGSQLPDLDTSTSRGELLSSPTASATVQKVMLRLKQLLDKLFRFTSPTPISWLIVFREK